MANACNTSATHMIFHGKRINSNLSGNEVYYTNSSILLVKNMLCSTLHCRTDFDLILFHSHIRSCQHLISRRCSRSASLWETPGPGALADPPSREYPAHKTQSSPDSGLGFQLEVLKTVQSVPCSRASGLRFLLSPLLYAATPRDRDRSELDGQRLKHQCHPHDAASASFLSSAVLDLRTTTSQNFEAGPRRARI